jgi:hypothetical protein
LNITVIYIIDIICANSGKEPLIKVSKTYVQDGNFDRPGATRSHIFVFVYVYSYLYIYIQVKRSRKLSTRFPIARIKEIKVRRERGQEEENV